jgi:hypothetical protein
MEAMPGLPDDLKPIATQPWEERPSDLPLDREECRTAIWNSRGNVTEAARVLKVSSARLRNFVRQSDYLSREVQEAREQIVDAAEQVVLDALSDPTRADPMARFVLGSLGKPRGWGQGGGNTVKLPGHTGNISITWADGTSMAVEAKEDPKTIEGDFKRVGEDVS